ncbi:MAG: T9SS type A sorting domain-containing protein, partial [Bacteroidia bacterium]|nr:T9SS type A sorting domain-containing protein [Bacteroidia bacterium]
VVNESTSIGFAAYPNPAADVLNVSLQTAAAYTLYVTDIAGREVYRESVAGRGILSIDLSAFQTGTYFLTVTDNSGKTGTEKFIVQ